MIDEYWTWVFYGYHSEELKPFSHKPIVVVCDECFKYRVSMMHRDNSLCGSCRQKGRTFSDESRKKMSDSHKGVPLSDEHRKNVAASWLGRCRTDETKLRISKTLNGHYVSEEQRRKQSATSQGIPYEEWTKFVKNGEYCEKFDIVCRSCHAKSHGVLWTARIEYLVKNVWNKV